MKIKYILILLLFISKLTFAQKWTEVGFKNVSAINAAASFSFAKTASGIIYVGNGSNIYKWDGTNFTSLEERTSEPTLGTEGLATDNTGNLIASVYKNSKYGVVKWNGISWIEVGQLNANNPIKSIITDAAGNIYAAGSFSNASYKTYVAKWNGTTWVDLGNLSANGAISTLAVDLQGNIYAAGEFRNTNSKYYVAKWNGTTWVEVGQLNANGAINSITTDVDGGLYAAGEFKNAGDFNYVAKWNGTAWTEVGAINANASITKIAVDASKSIYATGYFRIVSQYSNYGESHAYIAKWNGTTWTELGFLNGPSKNLIVDNSGAVYAQTTSGYAYVSKWDGNNWVKLGVEEKGELKGETGIITSTIDINQNVYVASYAKDSNGKYYVTKWDGTKWAELGTGANALNANSLIINLVSDKQGNIYASGYFKNENGQFYVAKWNGTNWSALGNNGTTSYITTLAVDLNGEIYGSGGLKNSNGKYYVAKWNGSSWVELGTLNANGIIQKIITDNLGNVFAAGQFTNGNGKRYVAKWNGSSWIELGNLGANSDIFSIASDGGNIYAAGNFYKSGGQQYVAKWNGVTWSELGSLNANNSINTLAIDNLGNVYAGGNFKFDINNSERYIAKWDGSNWTPLNSAKPAFTNTIRDINISSNGEIFASGDFKNNVGYNYLAKYNGTIWTEVGENTDAELHIEYPIVSLVTSSTGKVYYSSGDVYNSLGVGKIEGNRLLRSGDFYNPFFPNSNFTSNGELSADGLGNIFATVTYKSSFYNGYINQDFNKNGIQKFNGSGWLWYGDIPSQPDINRGAVINSITSDANGITYVGGTYTKNAGSNDEVINLHDGIGWQPPLIVSSTLPNGSVNCVYASNSGILYVAADFPSGNGGYHDLYQKTQNGLNQLNGFYDFNGKINTILTDNTGTLYVAGAFKNVNNKYYVAKRNGNAWEELGTGSNALNANLPIKKIIIDISGNIYAIGDFKNADNYYYIAKWNGITWKELGIDDNSFHFNTAINSICSDVGGNIYAGGNFRNSKGFYYIAKYTNPASLPVNLTSFEVSKQFDKQVNLNWRTASETNNNFFTVSKSQDGKVFEQLITVKSKGSNGANYETIDFVPFNGTSYYKLSQTDNDGKTEELGIRSVTFEKLDKQEIIIYPNPVLHNQFSFNISKLSGNQEIIITDLQGKEITRQKVFFENGKANVSVNTKIEKGLYLVKVNHTEIVQKIIFE